MAVIALAACSGGETSAPSVPTTTTTTVAPHPAADVPLAPPERGAGRLVLGSSLDVTLEIETCVRDDAATPEGTAPAELVVVEAAGTRSDGVAVLVEVRRFRTAGELPTITDTVTVVEGDEAAPQRVLQAQRFEVGGQVTDARDPGADDPILRLRADSVSGEAVFGPPGAFAGDEGLVTGRFALGCGA